MAALNTGNWLWRFQDEIRSAVQERSSESALIMANSVVEAVWDYDVEGADRILNGFTHLEDLVFVEVVSENGTFLRIDVQPDNGINLSNLGYKKNASPLHVSHDNIILFSNPIVHPSGGQIGVLVSGFSLERAHLLLAETRNTTIASQFISYGLLALLLVYVLGNVTRPLTRITGIIDDVTGGNLRKDVPFMDRKDEVGRLATAVSVFQSNARQLVQIEAEAESNRIIAETALIDELTNLPNRRALMGLFEQLEASGEASSNNNIALLHMDLDGFKPINDTLGHNAGDHILKVVAERLTSVFEGCRLVARIGGDEFVAVISDLEGKSEVVRRLSDELIDLIREPSEFEGQSIRVGCSVGIAYHSSHNRDLLDTLVQADIALYKAKANGKNQAVEFDEEQRRVLVKRKSLADQLHLAIEREEFVPFFQPIVDAHTEKITSFEVLSRWEHPQRGLVGPAEFLDLANELKLMRFVDRSVLQKAIHTVQGLAPEGMDLPRLSINVSVERLMEDDLMEMIGEVQGTSLNIDVEILESSYLDKLEEDVLWQVDRLRDMGAEIHLDDFGTGHSSVAGLLRLGPDMMKIDRQFIGPAMQSHRDKAVIEALIAIAKSFGIQVTCEGIETQGQATLMRDLGANKLQGFFFHRPMDARAVKSILLEGYSAHRKKSA